MASSGAGSSGDQEGKKESMEGISLTSIGMLKKIGHPSFRYFEWTFKTKLFEIFTLYDVIFKGLPDNDIIEFMKEIAKLLEMDAKTWRLLMAMFHDGFVGQTCAKGLLYDLLSMGAINDHQNIFNGTSMTIGDPRRLN